MTDDRQGGPWLPATAQVSDGDLVRLAREGDPVAFRLLIERHQPGVRARALRLAADRHEADDIMQEAFLQAFTSLPSLRDPERFAGWLAGIVLNVHRAIRRRPPLSLLRDWPEALHPTSAVGLPSAEDIDRAAALRAAVDKLPARQREAVELFYYADLPVDQIGESPGAAKASLYKARIRLRAYLAEHRADLVPSARRSPMTNVRIAHAEPLPGAQPDGNYNVDQVLVVLADDTGTQALPLWLSGFDGDALWRLLDRPRSAAELDALPPEAPSESLTITVLLAAGARVAGVEIGELGPRVTVAHVDLAGGAARPGRVTSRLGTGLALAAAAHAPVRVAGPLFKRLSVTIDSDDLLSPFLPGTPEPGPDGPPNRRRFEPRNLSFADGLDRWELRGSFRRAALGGGPGHPAVGGSHWQDYSCAAEGRSAVLAAAVAEPLGSARLVQEIFADDYRGATITLTAEVRSDAVAGEAALELAFRADEPCWPPQVDEGSPHVVTWTGTSGWTTREVTALVPPDADVISFGIKLTGPGQVRLRNAVLTRDG